MHVLWSHSLLQVPRFVTFFFHFSSRLCHISLRRPFCPVTRSRIAFFLIPCIFSSNRFVSQAFSVLFELLLLCIFIIAPENQIAIVFSYFFLFFRNIFCRSLIFLIVPEIFSVPSILYDFIYRHSVSLRSPVVGLGVGFC